MLRGAVEERTGQVVASEVVAGGLNCAVALKLTTERGRLFFKGVREADDEAVASLGWETRINHVVQGVSPVIHHCFRTAGWSCLAFAYIDGRHADLAPGSSDLAAVADALQRMQAFSGSTFPASPLADRFAPYLLPGEAGHLHGTNLLHTDTNPHNILIDRDGDARIVDWARPASGPAWVDPACTAVRLMECGQTPADALAWLGGFTSWRYANAKAIETFVNVTCRRWTATIGEHDAKRSNTRFRQLLSCRA